MNTTKPTLARTLEKQHFEAVAARCYELATDFVRAGVQVPSLVIMGSMKGDGIICSGPLLVPIENNLDKLMLTALMESAVESKQFDFVAHITEAWVVRNPEDMEHQPSKHPRRQEIVMVNMMSKECQIAVMNPLHRKPNRLERGTINFDMTIKGRMARETPPRN
jgi:hypothetical protein